MKILNPLFLFVAILLSFGLKGQIACESGSQQETCSAKIPPDAQVVNDDMIFSGVTINCFWVCSGDSLTLFNAFDCSIYLESKAKLTLGGVSNHVWGKSESTVNIIEGSLNTTVGILEDVIFIDDGTNTDVTICATVSYDYSIAPSGGCDLTSVTPGPEWASVQVYPNPVSGRASVLMTLPESYRGEILLSDSFGKLVKKWKSEGLQTLDLALEGVAPGVYLIHVPGVAWSEKIVVF